MFQPPSKRTTHTSKKGLDLPLKGTPVQEIHETHSVRQAAVVADDYVGMRPRMSVTVGDRVKIGSPLFEDRKTPGVIFTAPGSGVVSAINRGEHRALISVVIDLDDDNGEIAYESHTKKDAAALDRDEVRALLLESGLWTALRSRPFCRTAAPSAKPRALFITATDTNPLAPDPDVVLAQNPKDFKRGVAALSKLVDDGRTYLCLKAGSALANEDFQGAQVHLFGGPHPSGNVGYHMHVLDPVDRDRIAWHVGYQDVAAFGYLLRTGRQNLDRVVSVAGPAAVNPRLIKTRLGASLKELLRNEARDGDVRTISGAVLSGRDCAAADAAAFLGRYHNQVTLLFEGNERRFLGWMAPGADAFSVSRLFLSSAARGRLFNLDTAINGGVRAIVPNGAYDKVTPFEIMPQFLLRALMAQDTEAAEELGCLELDEEDLALYTFVCPSKIDYGAALRAALKTIEKEG